VRRTAWRRPQPAPGKGRGRPSSPLTPLSGGCGQVGPSLGLLAIMREGLALRPRVDIWFWLLVFWVLVVPYLFDTGHAASCDRTGRVVFTPLDQLVSGPGIAYRCSRE
jgi:hypothetical protein